MARSPSSTVDDRDAYDDSMRPVPWLLDVALMVGAFVGASAIAAACGAANFGTALTFGQVAFAITLVAILLKR